MSNKGINVNVLVAAKDEYLNQLENNLIPLIYQGIKAIYDDAVKKSGNHNTLKQLQIYLKNIPKWNQTLLDNETKRIKNDCPFLMDLVTAIFVSNVKILASVRLRGNHKNINIKIPTSSIFIHSIYIETAKKLFYNPYIMKKTNNIEKYRDNENTLKTYIKDSINEVVTQLIPIDMILQEYLVDAFDPDEEDNSNDESGTEISTESEGERSLNGDELDLDNEESDGTISSDESEPENSDDDTIQSKTVPIGSKLPNDPYRNNSKLNYSSNTSVHKNPYPNDENDEDENDEDENDEDEETLQEDNNFKPPQSHYQPPPQQFIPPQQSLYNSPPQTPINSPPQSPNNSPPQSPHDNKKSYSFFDSDKSDEDSD